MLRLASDNSEGLQCCIGGSILKIVPIMAEKATSYRPNMALRTAAWAAWPNSIGHKYVLSARNHQLRWPKRGWHASLNTVTHEPIP